MRLCQLAPATGLLLVGLSACADPPSAANTLCRSSTDRCQDDCIVVACLESGPATGACSVTPSHGALASIDPERLELWREDCEAAGGQWQQSELGTCPEMASLDGAKFELEIGCYLPEE